MCFGGALPVDLLQNAAVAFVDCQDPPPPCVASYVQRASLNAAIWLWLKNWYPKLLALVSGNMDQNLRFAPAVSF